MRSLTPRPALVALMLCAAAAVSVDAQKVFGFIDPLPTARLKQLFPRAVAFTPRDKDPLHFEAYAADPATRGTKPIGFAFWTQEIVPEERGYHGSMHILVGMDTRGVLTGVIVDHHTEPYGDFSIEPPAFAAQFKGKRIRDAFKVGADVDYVSRATITLNGASRAIRDSARLIAKTYLSPGALK